MIYEDTFIYSNIFLKPNKYVIIKGWFNFDVDLGA